MAAQKGLSTRPSLLIRLRDDSADTKAWDQFVDLYGRQILMWCRQWQLQEADAQDVTQMVLLKLVKHLPGFVYDPGRSFRGWLRTLTENAWKDFIADQHRGGRGSGDSGVGALLQSLQARDDLVKLLEEAYDQELLALAITAVRQRVEAHTWTAFQLTALEHVPAEVVAERLGMRIATVYRARSVVQNMLRETVAAHEPQA
jgi:RNA polymerase sigma-70 factor (ECF subfamily)